MHSILRRVARLYRRLTFSSARYWEARYAAGGNSGVGSYGDVARLKAEVLNSFVETNDVRSVMELGCGDGNQLALYRFPRYVGLDVSPTAIAQCRKRFKDRPEMSFFEYGRGKPVPAHLQPVDLTLSIDVMFHLIEVSVLHRYIRDLFRYSTRFVIVYTTNFERTHTSPHQVDREITRHVAQVVPDFSLVKTIVNPYKGPGTMADFFIYERCT